MCGVVGYISLRQDAMRPDTVQRMVETLEHRGPDGNGYFTEGNVALGHSRLSILDVSEKSSQPMRDRTRRYALSYNGELYNFKELRAQLERLGYQFETNGDTEVVFNSLICWGEEAFSKFNGMFALAFIDFHTSQLTLGRDRFGIKPLYVYQSDDLICFASEVKAILTHPEIDTEIDLDALVEYFTFQNILSQKTLIQNVKLLQPGHFSLFNFGSQNGISGKTYEYWSWEFREKNIQKTKQEYTEELEHLFRSAVKRQLISDVEVGSYLSGGIDSASISAIAAMQIPNIKTFTCGFDTSEVSVNEQHFDERINARKFSQNIASNHHEYEVTNKDFEKSLKSINWHLDEPRVGQCYPNYYAASLARQHVKVVLSGTGGDEIFGGYPWRYRNVIDCENGKDFTDKYFQYWQRMLNSSELKELFKPLLSKIDIMRPKKVFEQILLVDKQSSMKKEEIVNHCLTFEAKTFLHGLLIVEDKISMAHKLETRVPFLDNELVDFAQNVPVHMKLNLEKLSTSSQLNLSGKVILRDACSTIIGREHAVRTKQGFSAPDETWFRRESKDFVTSKLNNDKSTLFNFIDFNFVQKLVTEHMTEKRNHRLLLWSLISIEEKLTQYLGR